MDWKEFNAAHGIENGTPIPRFIDAIKTLRTERGMTLEAAKAEVERIYQQKGWPMK